MFSTIRDWLRAGYGWLTLCVCFTGCSELVVYLYRHLYCLSYLLFRGFACKLVLLC